MKTSKNKAPILGGSYHTFTDTFFINDANCHLIYVTGGAYTIEDSDRFDVYSQGALRFFSESSYRLYSDAASCTILDICIRSAFIKENLGDSVTLICDSVREPEGDYSYLREIAFRIASLFADDPSHYDLYLQSLGFSLLAEFEDRFAIKTFLPTAVSDGSGNGERIRQIIHFIEENYQNALSLTMLADHLHLSSAYLSRFFKNNMQCGFRTYLLETRLSHAYREISYTDDPVTDIAIRCGFSDASSMSRNFTAKYHKTPLECRNERKKKLLLRDYSSGTSDAFPIQETIIETSNLQGTPFRRDTGCILNAGSVRNLLHDDFCRSILESRQDLGIRYIRIQSLLSSSFIPRILSSQEFDFHLLDRVMDYLYSHDLLPMIELSKPPERRNELFEAAARHAHVGGLRGKRFLEKFSEMIQHCLLRYPGEWMNAWLFELWKPPQYTDEDYVREYAEIHSVLSSFLPGANMGGFGLEAGRSHHALETITAEFESAGLLPDFWSFSADLIIRQDTGLPLLSMNPRHLAGRIRVIHETLERLTPGIPIYITEWCSLFQEDLPLHASCYQSAFVIKTAMELGKYCQKLGYWYFRNPAITRNEAFLYANHFWSPCLTDSSDIRYPAYYALLFLQKLGVTLVSMGTDYCITMSAPDHYQILCFYYSHFAGSALPDQSRYESFSDTYQLFEEQSPVHRVFTLSPIPSGSYRITRHLLDRFHGSILDIWIGGFANSNCSESEYLRFIREPSSEIIRYRENSLKPEMRVIYISVDHSLRIETPLTQFSVCLWDISRLASSDDSPKRP